MGKINRLVRKTAVALVESIKQFPLDFARAWRELGRP
jgi:hypothetical protein